MDRMSGRDFKRIKRKKGILIFIRIESDILKRFSGLCSGKSSFLTPLSRFFCNGNALENSSQNAKSISVHPMPSDSISHMHGKSFAVVGSGSPNVSASGSGSSKEPHYQPFPGQPIKRRKRHRRKHTQNQEPCVMRGVYFKNMKWQAAIKVDKKQSHLGTVGSQEEAVRLYDRAAFMCRREPNFELSYKDANTQGIFDACATTVETLSEAGIHAEADLRENYSPGWKYSNWEMKGVSLKNYNEDSIFDEANISERTNGVRILDGDSSINRERFKAILSG
ncbi:hypothetical protein GQ457_01G009350 [Hibiscus cannabinus]